MLSKLPPLNALRAFSETARLGTTTAAARSLFRSHGAICRQIKILEDDLGTTLFDRKDGRLVLTDAGKKYTSVVQKALTLLERASVDLRQGRAENVLRIACSAAIAKRWLLSRITQFTEMNPSIHVHILNHIEGTPLEGITFDMAVVMIPIADPSLDVDPLMSDLIFPVRRYAEKQSLSGPELFYIRTPENLSHFDRWLTIARASGLAPRCIDIDDLDVAIEAATRGNGVLIANGQLIVNELAQSVLVHDNESALQVDVAYWLVQPVTASDRCRTSRAFASFLRSEAFDAFEELKRRAPTIIERRRHNGEVPRLFAS
ncbi:LysR family transcriptional regulator [Bradyrhizobium sp. SSUT77]|nr:LysR family transcriptional regulator [Bradyrhizobium sp. SSUT77]MDH2343608.1 LysR family transcriptional regulator [Bradyrhizobium sp. SSUT77]